MHIERILILEDSKEYSDAVIGILRNLGYTPDLAETVQQARDALGRAHYDLALMDVHLPDGASTDLLHEQAGKHGAPVFIMMSGQATLESAIEAMRFGAVNYLIKPFRAEQLEVALRQLEAWKRLTVETDYLRSQESSEPPIHMIVGNSPSIQMLKQLIQQVGPTDATVLIHGESGTGKEMVARALVDASSRRNQPYIKLNCTAIAENLIESEFFGHEKGAFTGAFQKRVGRFEMADNGTILLDEISELPLPLQSKLLRVLQEREFERVGGERTIKVNVRVLASTNRDLKATVKEGKFREDLFYRLNVVPVAVPALRSREGDIAVLLDYFLNHFTKRHGKALPLVPQETREAVCRNSWPGNVRELQNCVERAVILSSASRVLQPLDFGLTETEEYAKVDGAPAEDFSIEKMEGKLIHAALKKTDSNITKAAKLLGMSSRTLHYRIAQSRSGERKSPEI